MKKIFMATTLIMSFLIGTYDVSAAPGQNNFIATPASISSLKKPLGPTREEIERKKAEIDQRLGVTEEQKAQLKVIHEKAKLEIQPKIKELTSVEHEIDVLEKQRMSKERYDINTLENVQLSGKSIEQLQAEEKVLMDEIHKIRKAQFEESQKIFTDKQRKELEKMRQEHAKKAGQYGFHPWGAQDGRSMLKALPSK